VHDSSSPVLVGGLGACSDATPGGVQLLSCGWRHTIAVTAAGEVFSWGRGVNGQLGHAELKDTCAAPASSPVTGPPQTL
jgi:alpha-tubulin suppressor-like RCC1 family protein